MLPLIPFVFLARLVLASDISTFTDSACKNSYRDLNGPNGYPNGTCTKLNRDGTFGSFQVVGLDTGCAVTIYEADTTSDPCSGAAIIAAEAQCYGTSYVYYSIDECETPSGSSSASGSKTSTTSGASSTSPSSSSSTASSSASSTGTSTATPTAISAPISSKKSNAGAIAGGTIGGVAVVAFILLGLFFYMRRKKGTTAAELGDNPATGDEKRVHEMHADHAQELPAGGGAGGEVLELSAVNGEREKDGTYNMGTNASEKVYQEPVELPVHEHGSGNN